MPDLLLLILAFGLVLLNGFFVAAEFAIVKLRRTRVESLHKQHGLRGLLLVKVHSHLDAYLSACQLGITLASLGLGWLGEPAFSRLLEPVFTAAGVDDPEVRHASGFLVAFSILSYLHIVVGELAPKSTAIRFPESVALWTAAPLFAFYWLMYPAIWLLNASANLVLRALGLGDPHAGDSAYSAEELKLILRSGRAHGQFSGEAWQMLTHTLDFNELKVSDVMRPKTELVSLSSAQTLEENLAVVYRHRFSRYPYFDDTLGNFVGMVHLKDLFLAQQQGEPVNDFAPFLRPIQRVPRSLPAPELLRRFRTGGPHFAIVDDEVGEPIGFVTLDNLLGVLVGEIRDEFRPARGDWQRAQDGTLLGKGSLPIYTLERALGVEVSPQEAEEADTVGGLILEKLERLPTEGERVGFEQFDLVVKKMRGPRILLVKVYPRVAAEAL